MSGLSTLNAQDMQTYIDLFRKKKINSFALLVHKHPSTLFIVHPPTPNNRYNNALKIIRNNSSKAATLKKNNSLCTEGCGLPWNT